MSENNNELGSFLAGFVIGGLVGAATALILAPQSGQDMRSQIAGKSQELREQSGERLQQYRDLAGSSLTDARDRLQETSSPVLDQARIVLDTGKERAAQVKDQVSSYVRKDDGEVETSEGDAPEAAEA